MLQYLLIAPGLEQLGSASLSYHNTHVAPSFHLHCAQLCATGVCVPVLQVTLGTAAFSSQHHQNTLHHIF